MQLAGICHREREETLDDSGQFLELVVEDVQGLLIVFDASSFGKQQLSFPMQNGERSAQLVRRIGYELAKLADGGIHALQEVVEGLREAAEFVMSRGHGEGRPEPLRIFHLFRHERRMPGKSCDWRETPAYIERRN